MDRLKLILKFVCLLLFVIGSSIAQQQTLETTTKNDVAVRDSILLISTLDGSLHALSQRTGLIKWTVNVMPPVLRMSPVANISEENRQHFLLPDPKDGTLYLFNGFSNDKKQTLEKLPFTISELVSTSPCRSSDGMIYTSKKTDEWMVLDIQTGNIVDVINVDSPVCSTKTQPIPESLLPKTHNLLYLFVSEYQISIFNGETREKIYNFTFVDYSPSMLSTISQSAYDFLHLTSSTNGKIATIDITNGQNSFLWSQHLSSPIVSMYKLTETANFPIMHRVPFLTIGGFINTNTTNFFHSKLMFSSVYVGELTHSKSLYALSALVETHQIRKDSDYLIEGPNINSNREIDILKWLGYYEYPKDSDVKFTVIPKTQLIAMNKAGLKMSSRSAIDAASKLITNNALPYIEEISPLLVSNSIENYTFWLHNLIILLVLLIIISILVPLIIIYYLNKRSNNSKKSTDHNHSNSADIQIGKIAFNQTNIIGRGCAGTCVYKGLFEGKQQVAVKRIVSDCFKVANREIDLLRKLQHPNLIRYFATENDEQFSYVAIELAEMTLADYIEKKNPDISFCLNKKDLLHQACLGLAHLHSLDIVHRDIKPQNILISLPRSPNNDRKIMISDFGVSKILSSDSLTTDVSAGTEGWIAPEILHSKLQSNHDGNNNINEKASKPNDIFALGCLIYYTHTDGGHPFGDLLKRQTNILNNESNLTAINDEENICLHSLVEPMIAHKPEQRPPIDAVVKHPFFWNEKQSLQFMQDVSDRFECESNDSELFKILEQGSLDVCRGDWRRCITIELQEDLRKFRSYKGSSVRDLLRAIRNKRHHYHELNPSLQKSLGSIPNEFVQYFTKRFPRLIIHSYIAMQCCSTEAMFQHYYYQPQEEDKNNMDSDNRFKFKSLSRAQIRWNERWKEEGFDDNAFVFNIRHRTPKKSSSSANNHRNSSPVKSFNFNNNNFNNSHDLRKQQTEEAVQPSESQEPPLLQVTDSLFYNDVFKM